MKQYRGKDHSTTKKLIGNKYGLTAIDKTIWSLKPTLERTMRMESERDT